MAVPVPVPPSYPAMAMAVTVVGQHFCAPNYPVHLTIVRNMLNISEGNFGVTDAIGILIFEVKGKSLSRILLDASGNPILSLHPKKLSLHSRWKVYRGDSNDSRDLLFSVKKSSLLQFKTRLDVFLASNTNENNCDFKIKGSWFDRACTIYAGNTSVVIAQMQRRTLTVYPHVDFAFIIALVVILEEINTDSKNQSPSN